MEAEPILLDNFRVQNAEHLVEIIKEFLKNKVLLVVAQILGGNNSTKILPKQRLDALKGVEIIPTIKNGIKIVIKIRGPNEKNEEEETIYDFEVSDVRRALLEIFPKTLFIKYWPEPVENTISNRIAKFIYFSIDYVEKIDGERYSSRDLGIGDKFSFPSEYATKESNYCRIWEKISENEARLYVIECTAIPEETIQVDEEDKVIYRYIYGI